MLISQRECHSYYRDDHCLLIGYDGSRRDEKMNMFIFRRSRIEGESQSNRNCNSGFINCRRYKWLRVFVSVTTHPVTEVISSITVNGHCVVVAVDCLVTPSARPTCYFRPEILRSDHK